MPPSAVNLLNYDVYSDGAMQFLMVPRDQHPSLDAKITGIRATLNRNSPVKCEFVDILNDDGDGTFTISVKSRAAAGNPAAAMDIFQSEGILDENFFDTNAEFRKKIAGSLNKLNSWGDVVLLMVSQVEGQMHRYYPTATVTFDDGEIEVLSDSSMATHNPAAAAQASHSGSTSGSTAGTSSGASRKAAPKRRGRKTEVKIWLTQNHQ